MSVEKQLGEISGLLKGMDKSLNQRLDTQGNSIEQIRGSVGKTFDKIEELKEKALGGVTENETNIKAINKDLNDNIRPAIKAAQNKGVATGGVGILTGIGALLKDLFGGN